MICFRINKNGQNEYLMVQRKDSLGYVDFLRGKFNPNNDFNLINIIKEMTIDEINDIKKYDYSFLWNKLWNKKNEKYDKRNEEKFNTVKSKKFYLFEHFNMGWNEPEWGFPKEEEISKKKNMNVHFENSKKKLDTRKNI